MNTNYATFLRFPFLLFLWRLSFVPLAAAIPEARAVDIVTANEPEIVDEKELRKNSLDINSVLAVRLNRALGKPSLPRKFAGSISKVAELTGQERLKTSADSARAIFMELDKKNYYLDAKQLRGNELMRFPVGIKYDTGENTSVELAVVKGVFHEEYAELSVFLRVRIPGFDGAPTELFMGSDKVTFSYEAGIIESRMALLGDVAIPLQNMTLVLKGAPNRKTTDFYALTYAEFDCNEFRTVFMKANLVFSRDILVPYDTQRGRATRGNVKADVRTSAGNFNDLFIGIFLPPFAITGFERIGYLSDVAVLDFSDRRNPWGMQLSEKIRSTLPNPDSVNTWRGIYLNKFRVMLPPEFKKSNSKEFIQVNHEIGDPKSLQGRHVIIDRTGVNGEVYGTRAYGLQEGLASDWGMSLDVIRMKFESNQLVSGSLRGKLVSPTAKDTLGALRYTGIIQRGGNYVLTFDAGSKADFGSGKGAEVLAPNSFIALAEASDQFLLAAVLHTKSEVSAPARVKKPDVTPPSSPVFKNYSISAAGVRKSWANPLDKDLASVVLVRKSVPYPNYIKDLVMTETDTSWKVIKTFGGTSIDTSYLDTSVLPGKAYAYSIIAKDVTGLRSVPSIPLIVQTPIDMVAKGGIGTLTPTCNHTLNRIRLSWKYAAPKGEKVKSFQIYRSEGKGPLVFWQSAESPDRLIDDYGVKSKTEYNYAIRVLFKDGTASSWTKTTISYVKPE